MTRESPTGKDLRLVDLPLVFVTVGTDHHPFDRLIQWIDDWLANGRETRVSCFVQRGTSARPRHAHSSEYVAYTEMEAIIRSSIAVVSHGGPGSIMLCRYRDKWPIVVPRTRRLGEHVDDHQLAFSRRLAAAGEIRLAETEERLSQLLEEAVAGNPANSGNPTNSPTHGRGLAADAVHRFEALMDDLLDRRTGH